MGGPGLTLTRADLGCWLINLPRASARREAMVAQLGRMDLPWTLFDAIDGRARQAELAGSLDRETFERNMGRPVMWGEIGCFISHIEVWKAFLESPHQVALILEDDVIFHDDFIPALDLALAHKDRWDMLKLNKIRAKQPIRQGTIGPYALNAYAGPATGMGAYLIDRPTVQKMLDHLLPITMPIDYETNRFFRYDFRLFGLEPFPSHVEDGGVSTITGTNSAEVKKRPWYRRLPNYAMRIANHVRRRRWLREKGFLHPKS